MRRQSPDHDPNLRAAFALDAEAQRALLTDLCGQQPAPATPTPPHFQPVPVTTRRTSRGVFVCLPARFPASAKLAPDSDHLCIRIDHAALKRRSQPRAPHTIADLQAALDAHGHKRGIIALPFQTPRTWTIETLRDVVTLMAQHLPSSASDGREYVAQITQTAHIHVERSPRHRHPFPSQDGPFSAEVHVYPSAPVIHEWRARFGNNFYAGGTFEHIDQVLAARRERLSRPAPEPAQVTDDDQDDPLDAIEQAARRILHPGSTRQPALPRRFTDPTSDSWKATIRQFGRLTGADPRHIAALELTVDSVTLMLLNMRTVIDRRERGGE